MLHHPAQVVRGDMNVAVVDQKVRMASHQLHLNQIAHLGVRTQVLRAHDQLDGETGKLTLQALHISDDRILRVIHAKNDLVMRVILLTVTAKALVNVWIRAAKRLQYADGGAEGFSRTQKVFALPAQVQVDARAPDAEQIKADAANRQHTSDNLKDQEDSHPCLLIVT